MKKMSIGIENNINNDSVIKSFGVTAATTYISSKISSVSFIDIVIAINLS